MSVDSNVVQALAPHGHLRVAVNMSNFLLVNGTNEAGEPQGVSPDVGRLIADALGVPVSFVTFEGPGPVADAVDDDVWDIANIADEPARAKRIAFSSPYSEIQACFLVSAGSTLRHWDDIDVAGKRIAVKARAAYDLWLTDNLKHASLERYPSAEEAFDAFVAGGFDALASLRPKLLEQQPALAGSIILDKPFTAVKQCVGSRRGLPEAAQWLDTLVNEAVRSGVVSSLIQKHEVPGLSVPSES